MGVGFPEKAGSQNSSISANTTWLRLVVFGLLSVVFAHKLPSSKSKHHSASPRGVWTCSREVGPASSNTPPCREVYLIKISLNVNIVIALDIFSQHLEINVSLRL